MGQGLHQLRRVGRDFRMDAFLERFFYFRIGRRIMIDNLLAIQRTKVSERREAAEERRLRFFEKPSGERSRRGF